MHIGKSVKVRFLDSQNNLIRVKQFGEHMELLNTHSKTIEKLKNNVVETTEPKSLARIDKHIWNVHQFYIDLLIRFIDYVLEKIKGESESYVNVSELEQTIKTIGQENKNMLEAGREKIRDYEMMILETRRLGNEEFEKLKDIIKQKDTHISELKENTYRKSLIKKYLMGDESIKEKLQNVLVKCFEFDEKDQKEIADHLRNLKNGSGFLSGLGLF